MRTAAWPSLAAASEEELLYVRSRLLALICMPSVCVSGTSGRHQQHRTAACCWACASD